MENNLELLKSLLDAGKFRLVSEKLSLMNEADVADFFSTLSPKQTLLLFRLLPKDLAASVFAFWMQIKKVSLLFPLRTRI